MNDKSVKPAASVQEETQQPCWTFLSNHALVMMCLVDDPTVRMRDVAVQVGITERAVQRILTELEEGKYLQRHREGRRNFYIVDLTQSMRHPMTRNSRVADLLRLRLRSNDSPQIGGAIPENSRRPRLSQAANGTSYGRRRGPVPRQITPIEPASESNGSTHNGVAHNGVAHNGVAHNGVALKEIALNGVGPKEKELNGAAHNGKKSVSAVTKNKVATRGRIAKSVLTA